MTKQEFMENLKQVERMAPASHVFRHFFYDDNQELVDVNNEDYINIEMVYTYHPAIDEVAGKRQIAQIYAYGGMGVIRDMMPTAAKARQIELELREVQAKKRNLLAQLEELKTGKSGEEVIME